MRPTCSTWSASRPTGCDRFPHQLSGGMRQRVMIAMALALDPQVLIMDEPTTALDVVMQRQIVEQIAELRDRLGFSVIFITHDVSLLIEIADRIAIMYAGEIVEEAAAAGRLPAPAAPVLRRPAALVPAAARSRVASSAASRGRRPTCCQAPDGLPVPGPAAPDAFDACRAVEPILGPTRFGADEPHRRSPACCTTRRMGPSALPEMLAVRPGDRPMLPFTP